MPSNRTMQPNSHYLPALAFSLVELSIVLVILGLLTGGILAGQSLIRAAELRSISTDYERYLTAMHSFRDKYFTLPGDMNNATQFWGFSGTTAAPGCVSNSGIVAISTPGTCDGDNNAAIRGSAVIGATGESFQFWKQLALAGMVNGTYNGISDTGSGIDATPGFNVPRGRMGNSGFSIYYQTSVPASTYYNNLVLQKHLLHFGGERIGNASGPILSPEDAWNVDKKIDDGSPVTGRIVNFRSDYAATPNCTNGIADDSTYNFTSSDPLCCIVLITGY